MARSPNRPRGAARSAPVLAATLAATLAAGCGDMPIFGADPERVPTTLAIEAESTTLFPGEGAGLTAVLLDQRGNPFERAPFWVETGWLSTDDSVATVSGDRLTAHRPGPVTLRAENAGLLATLEVQVRHRVQTLEVLEPDTFTYEGEGLPFTVLARGWDGAEVVDVPLAWSSSAPGVVEVNEEGVAVGVGPGSATLTAGVADIFRAAPVEATVRLGVEAVAVAGMASAYGVQAVQRSQGGVPLVAGRPAVVRVFAVADPPLRYVRPRVRVRLYDDGGLFDSFELSRDQVGVGAGMQEGNLAASWNVPLSAEQVRPGLRILVDLDPDGEIRLAEGSVTRYPADGVPLALDVREAPLFRGRFVPVHQPGIGGPAISESNRAQYLDATLRMMPIGDYDVDLREPYHTSHLLDNQDNWVQVLNEMVALRVADGSTRYYHGIGRRVAGGIAGIAYVGHPAALSWDQMPQASATIAHEFGHNWGLWHAPCGGPSGVDNDFPYKDGSIGAWGMDPAASRLYAPSTNDVMSYCAPSWISDYHFEKVIQFRQAEAGGSGSAESARSGEVLLVWGSVGAGGARLEPGVLLSAPPSLPSRPGPITVEGYDEGGAVLFSLSFEGEALSEGAGDVRHFAFGVPLSPAERDRLHTMRLTAPGVREERVSSMGAPRRVELGAGRAEPAGLAAEAGPAGRTLVRWDSATYPLLVVRNPVTGNVLSFARGGEVTLSARPAELDLHLSDGVSSVARTRRVR